MSQHHTHERIIKLARRGLSHDSIARKIGRPGDVERVKEALDKAQRNRICAECGLMRCVAEERVCAWCTARNREEQEDK